MFHFQLGVIVSNIPHKFNKNVMKNDVTGVKDVSSAFCSGSVAADSGGALQAHSKGLNNKHNIPAIWYRFMFVPLFAFDRHTPQNIPMTSSRSFLQYCSSNDFSSAHIGIIVILLVYKCVAEIGIFQFHAAPSCGNFDLLIFY